MRGWRDGKAKVEIKLLDIHIEDREPQLLLGWFCYAWTRGKGALWLTGEETKDFLSRLFPIDIANDDQRHIIGLIPTLIKVHDTFAIEGFDSFTKADDWSAVRMHDIRQAKQFRGGA